MSCTSWTLNHQSRRQAFHTGVSARDCRGNGTVYGPRTQQSGARRGATCPVGRSHEKGQPWQNAWKSVSSPALARCKAMGRNIVRGLQAP